MSEALHNYFDLRWVDGYQSVTDAPAALAIAIEAFAAKVPSTTERATRVVGEVVCEGELRAIGVLRLDVEVPSATRVLRYLHAVVAVGAPGSMDEAAWEAAVSRRYGRDVEGRVRELYEELATTEKASGREQLRELEIRAEDLGASEQRPAATTTGRRAKSPVELLGARRAARTSRASLAVVAALALALGVGAGWFARGEHPSDAHELDALRRERALALDGYAKAIDALAGLQQRMAKEQQQCTADQSTMVRVRDDLQARLKQALDDRDTLKLQLESCVGRVQKGAR